MKPITKLHLKRIIPTLAIFVVVISIWFGYVVPEEYYIPTDYEIHFEYHGTNSIVKEYGGSLEKLFLTEILNEHVVNVSENILEIESEIVGIHPLTDEVIFSSHDVFYVDRTSKKHVGFEDLYYTFPINVEKKDYEFNHSLMILPHTQPVTLNFAGTDTINGLETYIFSCNYSIDTTEYFPQFLEYQIEGDFHCMFWVEPKTGNTIKVQFNWDNYFVEDGQRVYPLEKGGHKSPPYLVSLSTQFTKQKLQTLYLYENIIPTMIIGFTVFSVFVEFLYTQYISEKKRRIAELGEKTEKILLETIPNPVITFDQNNKLVDCNQSFLDKMGYSRDEIMEMYATDFLSEEDQKTYRDVIQPALSEGKPLIDIDLHIKKKDGTSFHALWSHVRNLGDNNEYLGFTAIGLDLTDIDELRDKLIMKEKFEVLGQMASNLAHDLKNPLASMKHSLEIIRRKTKIDDVALKESQRTDIAIKRIEHQVDQVLNYVKAQPLQTEDTTVLTILKQSLDLIPIPDNMSIEIPEKDLDVKWDETQISVVFTNIILNAIQAIEKDNGKIFVRILEEKETAIIEIENTGPNITEKDLEKIFEPLYTTKMVGIGLGLSGCKNIIKSHKGTITASNNPVTFTIKIPKIP